MANIFHGKSILITGGTGTIGSHLIDELLKQDPKVIRIFSRDEYKQYIMQQKYDGNSKLRFLLGDVREKQRLMRAMEGIDIVFHTAALKHVPACEYNPFEAVKTNVLGTQNVIECALELNCERVIYTSSDKSINPTNTMGATKLLAERLISAADYHKGKSRTIFCAVRFGNVMGSRGSVIPLFKDQILKDKCITVTHPDMTRFMMSINEAIRLTMLAAEKAQGGEIFILKMPVIKLNDLAESVIELMADKYSIPKTEIKIKYIGLRPGEKMYEELMTKVEAKNAKEFKEMFAIQPITSGIIHEYEGAKNVEEKDYTSNDYIPLSKNEIKDIILKEQLI
jgi:Polysaccharide biosynthesis protein.